MAHRPPDGPHQPAVDASSTSRWTTKPAISSSRRTRNSSAAPSTSSRGRSGSRATTLRYDAWASISARSSRATASCASGLLAGVARCRRSTPGRRSSRRPKRSHPARRDHVAGRLRPARQCQLPALRLAATSNVFASEQALGATDEYTKWDIDAVAAYSSGPHTFNVRSEGRRRSAAIRCRSMTCSSGAASCSNRATRSARCSASGSTFGRVVYTYKLLDQRLLEGLYAGLSLEAGRMDRPLVPGSPTGLLKSAAVFIGADTPFGPFYIGYGRATDGNQSAYLFLGRP